MNVNQSSTQPTPPGFELIGDFSIQADPAAKSCQYTGVCKNPAGRAIHPGQPSYHVKSQLSNTPYLLCEYCKAHVDQKPGTQMRQVHSVANGLGSPTTSRSGGAVLYPVDPVVIRAASSASQRGDLIRTRVAALPTMSMPHSPSRSLFASGPSTYVPGVTLSPQQGYSPNHSQYLAMKARTKQLRLASDPTSLEVCTISYTVETQCGKSSKIVFQIPSDGIAQVDARLTGLQLKELVMNSAAPHWAKCTFGYPFKPEVFTLRLHKTNVDLERHYPDLPAIYDQCLTASGRQRGRFAYGKQVKVILMLDTAEYERVESHVEISRARLDDPEDNDARPVTPPPPHIPQPSYSVVRNRLQPDSNQSHTRSATAHQASTSTADAYMRPPLLARIGPVIDTPGAPRRKRTLPTSPSSPPQSPPRKRVVPCPPASLSATSTAIQTSSRLEDALCKQGQNILISGLDGAKFDFVQFFTVPRTPYEHLVEDTAHLSTLLDDFTQVNYGTLSYNTMSPNALLGTGRFKQCFLGQAMMTSAPWPESPDRSLTVALKRPFQPHPSKPNCTIRLDHALEELSEIVTEASASQWAASMLAMTYAFVKEKQDADPNDPAVPTIPHLRFVHVGIAKCVHPGDRSPGALRGAFLVEERIPASLGFVRLLGNASSEPCVFPTGDIRNNVAKFCAFAQHVQWVLTEGRAFCADWQGGVDVSTGDTLLTDPQMITHPKLGKLFGGRNVAQTYLAFPTEHSCDNNDFCL